MDITKTSEGYDWKTLLIRGSFGFLVGIISVLYIVTNKYNKDALILITPIDNIFQFNKYFIVFYISWYAYVAIFVLYLCIFDKNAYYRVLSCLIFGMLSSYAIYYFFPTTVPRPTLIGDDFFTNLVRFIYNRDLPYNCLPSIHVLNTILVDIYINITKGVNHTLKIICRVMGTLIILSTMFVKQHVFLDVVAALILATIIMFITENIDKKYKVSDRLF